MTSKWSPMKPSSTSRLDVLAEVARGVVRLGAEHRADLVDALEHADHHLLVELRALREVRRAAEVVDREHVRAALGRGLDELGRSGSRRSRARRARARKPRIDGGGEPEDGAAPWDGD